MTRLPREVRERLTAELRDIEKFGFETQALRFEKGMSRIRRHPAKESNSENSYWNVLQGILCWVEVADLRLYFQLKDIYRPTFYDGTLAVDLDKNPDVKLLADLFDRKKPKQTGAILLDAPGIEIVDIDLDF
jgi:hypothetical protein